ncbi:MAG: J domain-containing protein [Candidatus Obscuribacterales bacterium]
MNDSEIRRLLCEILCVRPEASEEEIRQAYTSEAKKWHPDRVQHNSEFAALADKKLKEINQAYECLTDRAQFEKHGAKLAQRYKAEKGGVSGGASGSGSGSGSSSRSDSGSGSGSGSGFASGSSGAASGSSTSAADTSASSGAQPVDKSGIVKIFVATGIFVIIVVLVANLTAPRRDTSSNPGVVLSPSQSPGAPLQGSGAPNPQPALPSDSSIAAPPGSN